MTEPQRHFPIDPTTWISTNTADGVVSLAAPCHGCFAQSLWDGDHGQTAQRPPEVAAEAMDTQIHSSWLLQLLRKPEQLSWWFPLAGHHCQELSLASPKQCSAPADSHVISGTEPPER